MAGRTARDLVVALASTAGFVAGAIIGGPVMALALGLAGLGVAGVATTVAEKQKVR